MTIEIDMHPEAITAIFDNPPFPMSRCVANNDFDAADMATQFLYAARQVQRKHFGMTEKQFIEWVKEECGLGNGE